MDFHPFGVIGVPYVTSYHAHVRAHRRKLDGAVVVGGTDRLGVGLGDVEFADDFKYQVSTLITHVSCIQKILELRVYIQPTVRISICFVTDPVRPFPVARVYNRPCHFYASLYDDEALRIVDVAPESVVALRCSTRSRNSRRRLFERAGCRTLNTNIFVPDPTLPPVR